MSKQKSPPACSPVQQDELHRCLWMMFDWAADNPAHNLGSSGVRAAAAKARDLIVQQGEVTFQKPAICQ